MAEKGGEKGSGFGVQTSRTTKPIKGIPILEMFDDLNQCVHTKSKK